MVRCAIWYLCTIKKNVKNTHAGVLILVKLQAFTKINTPSWVFSLFFNCTNGTKWRNAPHILFVIGKGNWVRGPCMSLKGCQ